MPASPRKRVSNKSSAKDMVVKPRIDIQTCKRALLANMKSLQLTPDSQALQDLRALLEGTVSRGEGNSCLVLGPRGSGKSMIVDACISELKDSEPIVIRLYGWVHTTDRLALKEMVKQLTEQTGGSFATDDDDDDDDQQGNLQEDREQLSMPPVSQLHALVSLLPTLKRPTIVNIDAFDLFTLHPRQSLLYCLLDTVQSYQAGSSAKGLAVIGTTSRIDTLNLFEKRVKSRFSGRMFRTSAPSEWENWSNVIRTVLKTEGDGGWNDELDQFLSSPSVVQLLTDTFSLNRTVPSIVNLCRQISYSLSTSSPLPTHNQLHEAIQAQRSRPQFPFIHSLPYPAICLCIAAAHAETDGYPAVTFEVLHRSFRTQVRSSSAAPVQVNGGSIGMVSCSKPILLAAFEQLSSLGVFVPLGNATGGVAKEFVRYRFVLTREDIKAAVEKRGETNLARWLRRSSQ